MMKWIVVLTYVLSIVRCNNERGGLGEVGVGEWGSEDDDGSGQGWRG